MSTLEELLGLSPSSPEIIRAEQLADNDRALLRALVEIRHTRGLTQAAVGEIMGISQPSVAAFEAHDSNPTLATVRRYAHAVRALITHRVEPDEGELLDEQSREAWVTTSFKDVQVQVVAHTFEQREVTVTLAPPGAAGFRDAVARQRATFALAA